MSASGYSQVLTETAPALGSATDSDLFAGLSLTLPHLDSAGSFSTLNVSDGVYQRRLTTLKEWKRWSNQFPPSLRPSLKSCTPAEALCFLEQWRASRSGISRPGQPSAHAEIAPGTLRNYAGQLSQLCLAAGRNKTAWSLSNPTGNPVAHQDIQDYLRGYANHSFLNTPYVESGAVPIPLGTYLRLQEYLVDQADKERDPFQSALLWRDACVTAYLWETGQRGKEGCKLLITDFTYGDVRCTPAWLDLTEGCPRTDTPLFVESSLGTKSRKTKHPGTLELSVNPDHGMGSGVLVQLLPPYARAMRASGSPLLSKLFLPSNATQDGFRIAEFTSGAYNKRLQKHLKTLELWNGETGHSLRRGSTQLMKALGATVSEIGEKRLWRRDTTIDRYLHQTRHRSRLVPSAPDAPQPADAPAN